MLISTSITYAPLLDGVLSSLPSCCIVGDTSVKLEKLENRRTASKVEVSVKESIDYRLGWCADFVLVDFLFRRRLVTSGKKISLQIQGKGKLGSPTG